MIIYVNLINKDSNDIKSVILGVDANFRFDGYFFYIKYGNPKEKKLFIFLF